MTDEPMQEKGRKFVNSLTALQNLLLQKIDELPDPQNIFEARAQRILYSLEFAIRQLEDRCGALERLRHCSNCGYKRQPDWKHCPDCGHNFVTIGELR